MKVDNFRIIEELIFSKLEKNNQDNVILGRIIRRRKENPGDPTGDYIVKRYSFLNVEDFAEREEEIKRLCHMFNARFYVSTCIKSLKEIAFDISEKTPKLIRTGQYYFFRRIFDDTADANVGLRDHKVWVFDIDDKREVNNVIEYMRLWHADLLLGVIPTPNGAHILVKPFDPKLIDGMETVPLFDENHELIKTEKGYKTMRDIIDIKKNSLTVAYYSDEESV
jgi:hypothetical protein